MVDLMEKKRLPRVPKNDGELRDPLVDLREALLRLHKALIDSEKIGYEKIHGPIQSPHHFFQLMTSDPWFAWLRPITQLIVAIDETLDADEPLTRVSVDSLMNQAVFLLIPAESEGAFAERYTAALQRDPRVVMAHGRVAKHIGSGRTQAASDIKQ